MGLFAEWQPRYAEQGVATFPLLIEGKNKKPATKGYARTGLKGSGQLALRFPDVSALAFMAGIRSGVTIIDVDAPDDEDMLREVLARYGDTPMIIRTGSGGYHCYYAHAGEGRKIRADPNMPVDTLGGGVVVAPPSAGSRDDYRFIRGGLDNFHRLPFIRGDAGQAEARQAIKRELVQEGRRNDALFNHLMRQAKYVDTFDALLDVARTFAGDHFAVAIPDSEVVRTAKSAWWYETTGNNRFGQKQTLNIVCDQLDQVMKLGVDALMLFVYLQRRSKHRADLIVANDMCKIMPDGEWPRKRFAKARQALIDEGVLRETRPASTYHGPAIYTW